MCFSKSDGPYLLVSHRRHIEEEKKKKKIKYRLFNVSLCFMKINAVQKNVFKPVCLFMLSLPLSHALYCNGH